LSTQDATNGKCGSYYCGVTQEQLTPAINPAGACGDNPTYACKAELTAIVTKCASDNLLAHVIDLLATPPNTTAFQADVTKCVSDNPNVKSNNVKSTCIGCFVEAAMCCARDSACSGVCAGMDTGSTECDTAQKTAGCINPVFTCGGLPNPF
jgi:hypothetical protein